MHGQERGEMMSPPPLDGQDRAAASSAGASIRLPVDESPQRDTPQAVRDVRARTQGPYRTGVIDQGGAISQDWGITSRATTVMTDRAGRYAGSIDLATP